MDDPFVEKYVNLPLAAHEPMVEKYMIFTDACLGDVVRDALEIFAMREIPARLYVLEHGHECARCGSKQYIHAAQARKRANHRRAA